jgi:hypothetical protein
MPPQDKMKYRILYDYGSYEGMKLQDKKFDTVDEAVKYAVSQNYSTSFIIIQIAWTPNEKYD